MINGFEKQILLHREMRYFIVFDCILFYYICNKYNILRTLKKLNEYGEILIEKYIPGREIQVAILSNRILGAIELKPKRKFYDYDAKYNPKAKTEHIIPVDITKTQYKKNVEACKRIAMKLLSFCVPHRSGL